MNALQFDDKIILNFSKSLMKYPHDDDEEEGDSLVNHN
jgi:hypothetical protein